MGPRILSRGGCAGASDSERGIGFRGIRTVTRLVKDTLNPNPLNPEPREAVGCVAWVGGKGSSDSLAFRHKGVPFRTLGLTFRCFNFQFSGIRAVLF